jgi:hypothetical protein
MTKTPKRPAQSGPRICARRNSATLDSVGPPNEQPGGGILVPPGGSARGGRRSALIVMRITRAQQSLELGLLRLQLSEHA